jgi:THAP4-like, heme-binding beta-barrel domain
VGSAGSGDRAMAAAAERAKVTASRNIPAFDDLPVPADTANLREDANLNDALLALLLLVGVWRGQGEGSGHDGDYRFGQQIVVSHDGGDYLNWEARSWRLNDTGESGYTENPPFSGGLGLSGPLVTPDTLVVDIAPEIGFVLGVGNGDLLSGLLHGGARQVQFGDVGVEQLDVAEDPVGVDDDATHRRAVAVSRLQGVHAPPQAADEVVKFGEFSSGARQRIS